MTRDLAQAEAALAHWGSLGAPLRLIWRSENVVFETTLRDGTRAALRLHRPSYQGRAAIEAELDWCARLATADVPVATPIAAVNGRMTAGLGGRVVSCLRWLDGAPLGPADQPLAGSAVAARAGELGTLIARLHNATDAGACPVPFERKAWDAEALLGAHPFWGPFWENPALQADERADLLAARDLAGLQLRRAQDFGPIHADPIRGNVMATPNGLALIDFDDCGPGWRLYDLAAALIQSWGDPGMGRQAVDLLAGYRSLRTLPDDQAALLPLFVTLRGCASAGWIVPRVAADDPRLRSYAARAVGLARDLLAGRCPWGPAA
ncbi:MAG: phosphotransferase [Paracoccaceae bacterium]|nr:phosphotransferase [Paracoccaceae bacterium]